MSRQWTARRTTPLVEAEIDPSDFRAVYPLYRAGPERAEARKQVIRLLAAYTLVGLPLHAGVCFLATRSIELATAAVLVVAAILAVVSVAKWLGLEELLQKLPLLLLLVLVGTGLIYLASASPRKWGAESFEFFGTLLIVIAAISILSNLYRPLADAYQTLTLKLPVRDLSVAAAGLLVSLGLATLSRHLTPRGASVLACTLGAAFAALVVVEYTAWVRSNPARSLEPEPKGATRRDLSGHLGGILIGAFIAGISYGLLGSLLARPPQGAPWSDPCDTVFGQTDQLTMMRAVSGFGLFIGLFWVNASLDCLRPVVSLAGLRLAWDALVVFLTYPDTTHPLAHRISTRWLRPQSVRLVLAGVTLATFATPFFVTERKQAAPTSDFTPAALSSPSVYSPVPSGDAPVERTLRSRPGDNLDVPYAPPSAFAPYPPATPVASETRQPSGPGITEFAFATVSAALVPPVLVWVMVWLIGMVALPRYYTRYEKPIATESPR